MGTTLLALIGVVGFLLAAALVYGANGRARFRYRQLLLPCVALLYAAVVVWRFGDLSGLVETAIASDAGSDLLGEGVDQAGVAVVFLNTCIMLGFAVVKAVYKVAVSLLAVPYENGMKWLTSRFYVYDEDCQRWFLRDEYYGAKRLARVLYATTLVIAVLLFALLLALPTLAVFENAFYPSLAILILGEVCFCLFATSKREYLSSVEFEEDEATRIFQYAKLQELLSHYFGDRLLQKGSRAARRKDPETHDDFCEELALSGNRSSRLAADYFKSLVDRGVLGIDEKRSRYGDLNHDFATESARMLQGENVMFATPFYGDCVPYVALPVGHHLMRNRRVLVLHGSDASHDRLLAYVDECLAFATGVPGMWTVGRSLQEAVDDSCDVALVSFSELGDVRGIADASRYLGEVSFALVVDPSSLLATYQIGLNYLAEYLAKGIPASYCIFDNNSDGLVDSLSHALRVSITEVSATEYAQGSAVYMMWDADGEDLQHRLLPGVAQYLGMGTELGLVALRGQASSVFWAANASVPLLDLRWIVGQYYGELLAFAKLPQEQVVFDRSFKWHCDMRSMRKRDNCFVIAEDERCNMFEVFRQFATRGANQVFVNVVSPHYLLRDYMADNAEIFSCDPKAVPSFAPDFSRSQRNAIFSLVMMMAQSGNEMSEEEVSARLRYSGLSFCNAREVVEGLLIEHVAVRESGAVELPEDQLVVREAREYDAMGRKFVTKRYFSLKEQALRTEHFSSLRSIPLMTERLDGSTQVLGARLTGHVYQQFLPGQFFVLEGKYYEVVSISEQTGVLLRRAADHFFQRVYYRQLRAYELERWELEEGMASDRAIAGVRVQRILANVSVSTFGYLEMANYGDIESARRVDVSSVPLRRFKNKTALRIELPGASSEVVRTLAVLMSEFMVTMFPDDHDYIAVVALHGNSLPDGVLPAFACAEGDEAVYIFEDSLVDLGLISCIDRNVGRILELAWDYLDWHNSRLAGAMGDVAQWDLGEFPGFEPPEVKKGIVGRLKDKVEAVLHRRSEEDEPENEKVEEQESEGQGPDGWEPSDQECNVPVVDERECEDLDCQEFSSGVESKESE